MMRRFRLPLAVASWVLLAGGLAGAHDAANDAPNDVAPNRRDNIVPFFDAGDPKTRHDSDPTNDETRDDEEVRRERQRWRDEVRNDGSTGEVGDGCMDQYCYVGVSDQSGDLVRFDHTLSVGPASRAGDWNRVRVKALGAGAVIDFGGTQKAGPLGLPDGNGAGVYHPDSGTGSPDDHAGEPDLEPDDPTARETPSSLHFNHSPDHSWLGLAHSSSDHGNESEFASHDTHGGTIWADVYLPDEDRPTRVRDSNAGNSIIEHLSCPTCTDEYHEVWVDPERTIFQIGEMPDQAEWVARDPNRWINGEAEPENDLNGPTEPATTPLFDDVVNPNVDPLVSSATGAGAAASACCAPDPNQGGAFCNRNPGGIGMGAVEKGAVAGCVELPNGDCFGGAVTNTGPSGCMVVGGESTVGDQPVTAEECTAAAVAACCANGGCL